MSVSINKKFTPLGLLRFALPSIVMMVFMSLYTIVDGIFISRFAGSNALSSLNIVYPVINVVVAIAMMLASGGNAIISKYMGQGDNARARECISQFVAIGLFISVVIMVITLIFITPICRVLGASDILMDDCRMYLKVVVIFAPACMLQSLFQTYLNTAGRPQLGMILTIGAGILNAILDYVFIAICGMGVAGAALATGIGQSIPAIAGLIFFFASRGELRFTPFKIHIKEVGMACYNGSSEMITQMSNAIVTVLFNVILMKLVGEHGVAAITILLYGQFLFNAFYLGFTIGVSPVIGFQYGAGNKGQLWKIYKVSTIFVGASSVIIAILSIVAANPIVTIFTKDAATYELAVVGFKIFAVNFLFSGLNIVSSGIFTALSNGKISAIISFSRTLVFLVISLLTLPRILGITGVWIAVPVAEFMTLVLCIVMHFRYFIINGEKNYCR